MINEEDEIPWGNLSATALEELLFALTQAMSPRSVEWRSRPNAINTADGGRDIEATFDITTPDGDVEIQTWWIDCKRRKDTVHPRDVKEGLLNATVKKKVDVFVIATNSYFSNPTRDWVKEHADRFPKPLGKLWDRTHLSRLVHKYPAAAAQALPELLTAVERRDLVTTQFFERGRAMTEADLQFFWNGEPSVRRDGALLTAATYSQLLHGTWIERPWATLMDSSDVAAETLVLALTRLPTALVVTDRLNDHRVARSMAYILINALRVLSTNEALEILQKPFDFLEGIEISKHEIVQEAVVIPALRLASDELVDACSDDCFRIAIDPPLMLDPGEYGEHYWKRFSKHQDSSSEGSLIITNLSQPCVVGFPVSKEKPCPLMAEPTVSRDVITAIRAVVEYRVKYPKFQALHLRQSEA